MTTTRKAIGSRRIPIHDHYDLNSGGKLTVAGAISGGLDTITGSIPPGVDADTLDGYVQVVEGGRDTVFPHDSLGATEDIDPTDGNVHSGTLNADCAITLLAPDTARASAVTILELYLTEDGTGGWTPTFDADGGTIAWPGGGAAPAHTTTAGSLTRYVFETMDDGVTWYGIQIGSSASALTVEDEGVALATAATTLDFVGSGVTASGVGAEKTITIPGVTADALTALGVVGPLLIADDHSTPIIFGDLLLTEDGDDFLYGDLGG